MFVCVYVLSQQFGAVVLYVTSIPLLRLVFVFAALHMIIALIMLSATQLITASNMA